jgi:uncharacterized membrane protein YfcA
MAIGRNLQMRRAMPFIIGGLFGIPLGVWLLRYVDPVMFRGGVGIFLICYCTVMLLSRHLPAITRAGVVWDAVAGWIGGVMGGLGGLTGPAPTLWCTLRGWERDTQRSVFQAFNLSMQIVTMATYLVDGTVTASIARIFAVMLPAAILPTLAGVRLYRRFSTVGFQRMVLILLLISGILLTLSLLH